MNEPGDRASTFFFLAIDRGAGLTLASERISDRTRAVLVFDAFVDVEAFRIIEELGPEWEIVEHAPQEAAFLLERCREKGVRYVALNPPTKLTRADSHAQEGSELVPIRRFVDYLRGE